MKKIILLFGMFLTIVFSANAAWGHRYETVQSDQNPMIYVGQSVTMSVEWGEGEWTQSQIGYGKTQDGTDWTWVDINWFEDGEGTNKRCKVDLTPDIGVYYYAYKFEKSSVETYQYGSGDWSANVAWATDSVVSFITVLPKNNYSGSVEDPSLVSTGLNTIVINYKEGYEYAIIVGGGDTSSLIFQDDTVFFDLAANTQYDVYQRVKETETCKASSLSEKLQVTTDIQTTWGHRYEAVQSDQNPTVYVGRSVAMSVEWNEGAWTQSQIGYGKTQDGTDWTWVDISWFEDGDAANKRCKTDLALDTGVYYYVYKFANDSLSGYQYGSSVWTKNAVWDTEQIVSYITVSDKEKYTGEVIAPSVAVVDINAITVNKVEGYEYAITTAGGDTSSLAFQDDTLFSSLDVNTQYDLYQRVKATDTMYASVLSDKVTQKTDMATTIPVLSTSEFKVISNNGYLQFQIPASEMQNISISIINLAGQVCATCQTNVVSGNNTINLSSNVKSGIYLLKLRMGTEIFVKKIAIQ